jgi:hypothetical protein
VSNENATYRTLLGADPGNKIHVSPEPTGDVWVGIELADGASASIRLNPAGAAYLAGWFAAHSGVVRDVV